jgi:hypothetical protein
VLDFFAGYNVNEVAFVYEPDGRPSGLVRIVSEELVQLCRERVVAFSAQWALGWILTMHIVVVSDVPCGLCLACFLANS